MTSVRPELTRRPGDAGYAGAGAGRLGVIGPDLGVVPRSSTLALAASTSLPRTAPAEALAARLGAWVAIAAGEVEGEIAALLRPVSPRP